ncbi:class I SAM-dependent methyltransferase [Streptomyces marincola]|uniref:class I SAM-dependent methyltransferase n=1 Tax=Streptomyces marincola TaxID=2878388 RepID=UPI001CF3F276|nr:class I SAM-dependent methyltransferase [Streptomyces marincola]UCM89388.1 methyltransferase domain-containing protein [Streptomyces marincola]
MYGSDFARIYDDVYTLRGKDYGRETADVVDLIRELAPNAASLLDVGCGTGGHLVYLADHFDEVEGLELSPDMLAVAKERLPGTTLHQGDMRAFDTGRRYDAVISLFGTISHAYTEPDLRAVFDCFAAHLNPGGVLVAEPWWFEEDFIDGYISADVIEPEGQTMARVSHSKREGDSSRMEVHYLTSDAKSGTRHFSEVYRHRLYTRDQYEAALRHSGFSPRHRPGIAQGRGLFFAVRDGS